MTEAKQETADHKSIAAALAAFQSEYPPIPKTRTATIPGKDGKPGYIYKYADLGDILDAIRPVLAEHGLSFTQAAITSDAQVGCRTDLYHPCGGSIIGEVLTLNAGPTPQTAGSALTYARRYSLTAALGIATEEDDDGAGASHGGGDKAAQKPAATRSGSGGGGSASDDFNLPFDYRNRGKGTSLRAIAAEGDLEWLAGFAVNYGYNSNGEENPTYAEKNAKARKLAQSLVDAGGEPKSEVETWAESEPSTEDIPF